MLISKGKEKFIEMIKKILLVQFQMHSNYLLYKNDNRGILKLTYFDLKHRLDQDYSQINVEFENNQKKSTATPKLNQTGIQTKMKRK